MACESAETTKPGEAAAAMAACHLVGMPKSGTTLLLALLDGHPELQVFPEELRFYGTAKGHDDGAARLLEGGALRLLARGAAEGLGGTRNYGHVDGAGLAADIAALGARGLRDRALLEGIMASWRDRSGSGVGTPRIWVEKSPGNEYFLPVITGWFGRASAIVHMVRDPRDVFVSLSRARESVGTPLDPETFATQWGFSAEIARDAARRYPGFQVVRYEDLAAEPRAVMIGLARGLGIAWDDRLLVPTRAGVPWRGNSMHDRTFAGVGADSVGLHREGLDDAARRVIEGRLACAMRRHGYGPVAVGPRAMFDLARQRLRRMRWQRRMEAS